MWLWQGKCCTSKVQTPKIYSVEKIELIWLLFVNSFLTTICSFGVTHFTRLDDALCDDDALHCVWWHVLYTILEIGGKFQFFESDRSAGSPLFVRYSVQCRIANLPIWLRYKMSRFSSLVRIWKALDKEAKYWTASLTSMNTPSELGGCNFSRAYVG